MASLRSRTRADGTTAHAVLYTHKGQQTSVTFDTAEAAREFRDAINSIGAEKAMTAWGIAPTAKAAKRSTAPTVADWCRRYIDTRTGVTKGCIYDYNSYLRNDISGPLGDIPLDLLAFDDVADWVQDLADRGLAGKTIANRHGFLSAALNEAVRAEVIPVNPAAGTRLPRSEKREMLFLDEDEFELFKSCFTERWRPMLDFMVASGVRLGELCALTPADVDRKRGTVHVGKGRKRTYDKDRYEVGPTKTKKSDRTINMDPVVLSRLDYSHEYLFVNSKGNAIDGTSFRSNVWYPARAKAQKLGMKKKPRIHDMRHTCASWLIQAGEPLPVIQQHLGHESISTTVNLYGHLDRKSAEKAAAVFGKILGRS